MGAPELRRSRRRHHLRTVPVLAGLLLALLTPAALAAPAPPRVVVGRDGWLFISQDWRVACQDRGRAAQVAARVRDLVTAVRAGGRRIVVVVGPDKSTVMRAEVPAAGVPDRTCGDTARAAAWDALADVPGFLDLRPALRLSTHGPLPTYWRKDTHWSPTGGAVYARALAQRLDPAVAGAVVLRKGTFSRHGDLARDLGRPDAETVPGVELVNPGVTVVDEGFWSIGTPQPALVSETVAAPGSSVLPGRTVVVGDSFTAIAYDSVAPLSQETVFFHPGYTGGDPAPIVRQLEQADTVVVQVVERFDQRYRMFQPDVVDAVRRMRPRSEVLAAPGTPVGTPCGCGLPPSAAPPSS